MKVEHRDKTEQDILLIHQTLLGDKTAFEKLVYKYLPAVYALVLSYVKNADDAEDLTQEVFIKAYQNLRSLENRSQFSSWLWQIARNHCIDWLRQQKQALLSLEEVKETESSSRSPSPEETVIRKELIKTVRQAVDSLSEIEKKLLKSYYLEGASYEQLQREHGLSYFAVAHHLHRAKQKVRKNVQKLLKGFYALPWRKVGAVREPPLRLGSIEAVNLTLKTKAVIMSMVGVLGFGGFGVWYLHSKPIPKTYIAQREEGRGVLQYAPTKIPIPKSESNAVPQVQPANPLTATETEQAKILEPEGASEQLATIPSTWVEHNRLDEEQEEENQAESVTLEQSIMDVLTHKFIAAYEMEDIDLYESAFWSDDFSYHSDVATADPNDDVLFTDFSIELRSAKRIFDAFGEIRLQLSNIELEPIPSDENTVRVKAYYNIAGFPDWRASGIQEFTLKKRNEEWRISRWVDWAFGP